MELCSTVVQQQLGLLGFIKKIVRWKNQWYLNLFRCDNIESLQKSGTQIRKLINEGEFSDDFKESIKYIRFKRSFW